MTEKESNGELREAQCSSHYLPLGTPLNDFSPNPMVAAGWAG